MGTQPGRRLLDRGIQLGGGPVANPVWWMPVVSLVGMADFGLPLDHLTLSHPASRKGEGTNAKDTLPVTTTALVAQRLPLLVTTALTTNNHGGRTLAPERYAAISVATPLRDRPRTAERQSQNERLGTHAILPALAPPG
jgi:hypothetical protein